MRSVWTTLCSFMLIALGFLGSTRTIWAEGWGVIPAFAPYYTPDTRLGMGVYLILCKESGEEEAGAAHQGKTNEISLFFTGTQNLQVSVGVQPELYFSKGQYRVSGYMEVSRYPGSFWGIGSSTESEQKEGYEPVYGILKGSLYRRLGSTLYVGPRVGYKYIDIETNEALSMLRGGQGSTVTGFGMGGVYDSRNSPFYPTQGLWAESFVEIYQKAWGSDWDFGFAQLDLRGYFPVGEEGVLALQAKLQASWGEVPFLSLPSLGGSMIMRGYPLGRFQDTNSIAFQGEYRFPLLGRLGGVVFFGAGDVQPTFGEYSFSSLKLVGGGGLRLLLDPKRRIHARLDVGVTAEGLGIYVLVKEAF
ncbi:MAG: BamA/TamA family outer membrane protein [Spirochaetales bacterium]